MEMELSSEGSQGSAPRYPPDSPGSSVSTRLQEEYEELLKYAVVMPNYDPKTLSQKLADNMSSFNKREQLQQPAESRTMDTDDSRAVQDTDREEDLRIPLPDFGQSPVRPRLQESDQDSDVLLEKERWQADFEKMPPPRSYLPQQQQQQQQHREERRMPREDVLETVTVTTMDPDLGRMENLLDQWTLDLKRNVLAEYGQSKIRIVETSRQELGKDRDKFEKEKSRLMAEVDQLKELLHTYEQSMERKDQVIANMTSAMQKQRDRIEMTRRFSDWRMRHNDKMREDFASNLARRHYRQALLKRVWQGWFSLIESKWRHRVEKACQAKASQVCQRLREDYEAKLAASTEALEQAREEVTRMNWQKEQYEEAMKKAFMRGVCALNLEAMTIFHEQEEQEEQRAASPPVVDGLSDNLDGLQPEKDFSGMKTLPPEAFTSDPGPRVVTTLSGHRGDTTTAPTSRSTTARSASTVSSRGKHVSAKISGKGEATRSASREGGATLNPPMPSVIVERHQPIVKETIGQATATKYPVKGQSSAGSGSGGGIAFRRLAGQSGPVTITPNVQSVKVVD